MSDALPSSYPRKAMCIKVLAFYLLYIHNLELSVQLDSKHVDHIASRQKQQRTVQIMA